MEAEFGFVQAAVGISGGLEGLEGLAELAGLGLGCVNNRCWKNYSSSRRLQKAPRSFSPCKSAYRGIRDDRSLKSRKADSRFFGIAQLHGGVKSLPCEVVSSVVSEFPALEVIYQPSRTWDRFESVFHFFCGKCCGVERIRFCPF